MPPIWRILENAQLPVGTFNVKFAMPTSLDRPTGFMVSRDARPEIHPDLVYPPELYARLTRRFGQWATGTKAKTASDWESLVPREVETRKNVLLELLQTRPWSFALVNQLEIGRAQHRFWGDGTNILRSIYTAVDRALADIVSSVGPETYVFVFSECGAGPVRHGVHLNAWLEREGYLRRHRRRLFSRLGLSIARAHKRARRLLPRSWDISALKMRVRATITTSNIDWTRTRAYSLGDTSELVFNVQDAERDALADELRCKLLALRDPEGRRVVEDVIPRAAWGASWDVAPDLTIVWDDDAYMPTESFDESGRVFVDWCPEQANWKFKGSHRREGLLLVSGPGIAPLDLGSVRTVDLVPTWLDLLGVTLPKELEGASFASKLFQPARCQP